MRRLIPHRRVTRRGLLAGSAALGFAGMARATAAPARPIGQRWRAPRSSFAIGCDAHGITSLKRRDDAFDTDYVAPGEALGGVQITWRRGGGDWHHAAVSLAPAADTRDGAIESVHRIGDGTIEVRLAMRLDGEHLLWSIALRNLADTPAEIGDLALPLPMNTHFTADKPATAAVLKHSFVSGAGSHLFWMRSNSVGPYLTMLPEPGTHFEYWDVRHEGIDGRPIYAAYIHSAAAGAVARAKGCRWRQPNTALQLAPAGAPGDCRSYGARFGWAANYQGVRDAIVAAGLIDIDVVPGMTVPSDAAPLIALRATGPINGLDAEHRGTQVTHVGRRGDREIYRVRFVRLGENRLAIRHGNGGVTYLEFFATEPIETLIRKRGAFIARHQHRDPAKWYDGLFAEWNMASEVMLGPDNYDRIKGWRIYEVTCDDPGLSKPAFLAAKNAEYPDQSEVTALDRYIDRFVWGGLQRTTAERYPYAIYGIPDWHANRTSNDPGKKGRLHIWRVYDYPHIIQMYFAMHRIARDHAHIKTHHDAALYLERAYRTTVAMFTVPDAVTGWSPYQTGYYNEIVIPALIEALEEAGRRDAADVLRRYWERKVRYFVSGDPNLFGSEYAFDSTGFESTAAIARYAIDEGKTMGIGADSARAFADRQLAANIFCRGWLEPAYYYLGSDYRGRGGNGYTLTYMAQMGGWGVLDHALHDAADPHPLLRLGYASYLSAWALMNTGTPESDYGYWYPGQANDGGAGGGFEPAPYGETWLDQPHHRGSWYYSCEIDLGFCGALRDAATILADDPVFGRICYGGDWRRSGDALAITPRDGVRRRLHVRLRELRLSMILDRDRFVSAPIVIEASGKLLRLAIESDNPHAHTARLTITGLAPGAYDVAGASAERRLTIAAAGPLAIEVAVRGGKGAIVIRRSSAGAS